MSKNTSITLGQHFESFVTEQLNSGRCASTSEIVRAGLRLLEGEEAKLTTLKRMIEEGAISEFVLSMTGTIGDRRE